MAASKRKRGGSKGSSRSSSSVNVNFKAAHGTPFDDKDIEKIVPVLVKIAKRDGGKVTKQAVLEEARKPSSPLHKYFEWDVHEAAEKYWLIQAQRIIQAVQYEIKTGKTTINVRALHKVISTKDDLPDADPGAGYVFASTAVEENSFQEQILQSALRDLQLFKSRYETLAKTFKELGPVLEAINELEGKSKKN